MELTNNLKTNIGERDSHLANNVHANKHRDCLSSPEAEMYIRFF